MHLCFEHTSDWNVAAVPLAVNVLLHPLPTARRCWRLGPAIRQAVEADARDLKVVILGTGDRQSDVWGKSVSVGVGLGGRRILQKTKSREHKLKIELSQ